MKNLKFLLLESKYIVSTNVRKKNGDYYMDSLLSYISNTMAEKNIGSSYIEKYQFEMMPGSQPLYFKY